MRSKRPTSEKKHHDAHRHKYANENGPESMTKSTLFDEKQLESLIVDQISYEMTMTDPPENLYGSRGTLKHTPVPWNTDRDPQVP
jgi:hypothetical protein